MKNLFLRLTVQLENLELPEFFRPHGPLFTHWLPNGLSDAVEVRCAHKGNQLRLWFERRGYVERDFIRYDPRRREVDKISMQRQAKLEAGDLHGEGQFVALTSPEMKAIEDNAIGHEDYIAAGKRVVEFLYTPVSNLIAVLKYQYGQYWLPSLDAWDSRRQTLGGYCSSTFFLRWRSSEEQEWQPFLPTQQGSTFIVGPPPGRGYGEYLSREDWEKIKKTDLNAALHLASIILGRANELFDTGQLRQAFVEAGSAAELAVNKYVLARGQALGIRDSSLDQFFELPLAKQIAVTVTLSQMDVGPMLPKALKAIDTRNRIVHKGEHPSTNDADCLRALFKVVAAILEADHKFPILTSSNALNAKPAEK